MRASKNKIYIAKEKIQTLQQGEVGKLVKAERMTRKQVIRKLLFVTPFVWSLILILFGFQCSYYCECVEEGIRINRYDYLRKVETTICPTKSLNALQVKREYRHGGGRRGGGSVFIVVQCHMDNQIVTLLEAPVNPRGRLGSLFSLERKITHYYLNKIKQLTTPGQTLWLFPYLCMWWTVIPFLLVFTLGIGKLWIEFSAEEPKNKVNHT